MRAGSSPASRTRYIKGADVPLCDTDLHSEPVLQVPAGVQVYTAPLIYLYLAGVTGSMSVSKTVGRGSNPWRDATIGANHGST